MNLLINFSTLKKGGGQNMAMNFLYQVFNMSFDNINFFFFVAENSEPHRYLKSMCKNNYYVVPSHPIKRILFELFWSSKILNENKIELIYSYCGFGLFPKRIPQVSGSVDSNLYFPEIDFWSHYKGISRFKKKLIDIYRTYGLKRVTAIVFENELLKERAYTIYKLNNTIFIKPSINFNFDEKDYINLNIESTAITKGLFLCGWQLNKNIMKIPEIAFELKKNKFKMIFVITAPEDNSIEHKYFLKLINKYNVGDMIKLIGSVTKKQLPSLYEQIDYVFLLSKLESFSNNIIESWYFNKVLIISDELWSRSICKDAAVYVNRDSSVEIARTIIKLQNNNKLLNNLVYKGKNELKNYPIISERIKKEMEYLEYVYTNY